MTASTAFKGTNLFKPIKLGDIELQHRVALAPLTRLRNDPTTLEPNLELAKAYYSQRSQRPGTLIITEGTISDESGGGIPGVPGAFTEEQATRWRQIFEVIHNNGSFVVSQLCDLGRQAIPGVLKQAGKRYLAPSSIYIAGDESVPNSKVSSEAVGVELEALTIEEIETIQDEFVSNAKRLIEYGADGVQVHVANGYLFNEFIDHRTNQRTDKYGGSIENRSRFVIELIDKLDTALGGLEKVSVRLSPYGIYIDLKGTGGDPTLFAQYAHLVGELELRAQKGKPLQFLDLVEPRYNKQVDSSAKIDNTSNDFILKIWSGVVVKAGNFGNDFDALKEAIEDERVVIAIGRNFISNPDLVDRLENGWELTPYDRSTFYTSGAKGYTDYSNYK